MRRENDLTAFDTILAADQSALKGMRLLGERESSVLASSACEPAPKVNTRYPVPIPMQ